MRRTITAVLAFAALGAAAAEARGPDPYVRATLGFDWSGGADFHDLDCLSVAPPVLYGCGPGIDFSPLGAYGDFGRSAAFEAGIGVHVAPDARLEFVLGFHPGFAFAGQANFVRTPGLQTVTGAVSVFTAMGFAYLDLGTVLGLSGPVQPFVGAGAGLSRNTIGPMLMTFPGLASQPATTTTPGGTYVSGAIAVVAGIEADVGERATLELAFRRTDYGQVMTDEGPLTIVRGARTTIVGIARTEAHLVANGVTLGLRIGF
jgi:opacity protein-like surface antigen